MAGAAVGGRDSAHRAARLRASSWRSSSRARPSITDSGGVQEESTYLGIPCLTLRENTERPITVTQGSNRLVAAHDLSQSLERRARTAVADGLAPRWLGRAGSGALRRCA